MAGRQILLEEETLAAEKSLVYDVAIRKSSVHKGERNYSQGELQEGTTHKDDNSLYARCATASLICYTCN